MSFPQNLQLYRETGEAQQQTWSNKDLGKEVTEYLNHVIYM